MEAIDLSFSKFESVKLREANNFIELHFFRNIFFFNGLLNFIEWKITLSTFENKPWFYQWISKHGSLMVLRFSDSQFLLQLVYLQSRFESLSQVMLLDKSLQMENDTHLRMIYAKKCYNMLLGVLKKVNHRFENSIVVTNFNNFLCITIDLYWNFSTLYFGGNRYWQGEWVTYLNYSTSVWLYIFLFVESFLNTLTQFVHICYFYKICDNFSKSSILTQTALYRKLTTRTRNLKNMKLVIK